MSVKVSAAATQQDGAPDRGNGRAWGRGATAALAVVLLFGGWVRFADLGGAPFFGDELDHYYAATALAEGEGPQLPSGNAYRRALDFTHLVRAGLGVVDDPRVGARLPAAVLGFASLVLIALIGWKWGGPWAGVWAALLLAIYPEAIVQSRQTRFYTYQLCFGLIALYSGWKAVAPDEDPRLKARAVWAVSAFAAFAIALRVQPTTLSVMAGWYSAVCVLAVRDLSVHGKRAGTRTHSVALAGLGVSGVVLLALVQPSTIQGMLERSSYVALWAEGARADVRSYYWHLSEAFPVLVAFAPASFLAVLLRRPWLGVYLFLWFVVPLTAHTFLFPWKAERYVLLAIPGLLLATAIAASAACRLFSAQVARILRERVPTLGQDRATRISWGVILLAASLAVLTSRAFNDSLDRPTSQPIRNWDEAWRIMAREGLDTVPVGSSQALVALHNWGRVDFNVGIDFLESRGAGERVRPEGSADWYSGVPVLTLPASIRSSFPRATVFAIAIDRGRWNHGNIAPQLRETLQREGESLCGEACGDLLLFRWVPPTEDTPEPANDEGSRGPSG